MIQQPQKKGSGGVIRHVKPGSIADDLALLPGSTIRAINGLYLRDVIDYRFAVADEQVEVLVSAADGEVFYDIEKDPDEDLGVEFVEPLFEHVHVCQNACLFCFLKQLPGNMRESLYVRDDDYRLSFLYGNFITLTNLHESDWERIEQQHLSPLYVSVHATSSDLRARLMGRRADTMPDVLDQIRRLGQAGIEVHTQVVLCPGINDGAALQQTLVDLAALYPTVQSIALVPVGVTRYRDTALPRGVSLRCFTPAESARLVELADTVGQRFCREKGKRLVYPSDELVLSAGCAIAPASAYEGFPQYFNGVGMTRDFLDSWERAAPRLPRRVLRPTRMAMVCGTLFAPVLQGVAEQMNRTVEGLEVGVVPVVNQFFGETVTVSGLLTGQDVMATLQPLDYDQFLLPRVLFDYAGTQTLDGYSLHALQQCVGRPVATAGQPSELVHALQAVMSGHG